MRLPIRLVGRDVLFAHWPVDPDALAGYVPAPLSLDTYDGSAWVSALALRAKPAVRGVPTVPQVLFRTYVSHDGERGVRFLTCDSAVGLGGLSERPFGLPLRRARIDLDRRGEAFVVRSRRLGGEAARFDARYRPTGPATRVDPDSLAGFLLERHRYYTPVDGGLVVGSVERDPWRLAPVEADVRTNTLFEALGLSPPASAPVTAYCPRFEPRFLGTDRLG